MVVHLLLDVLHLERLANVNPTEIWDLVEVGPDHFVDICSQGKQFIMSDNLIEVKI